MEKKYDLMALRSQKALTSITNGSKEKEEELFRLVHHIFHQDVFESLEKIEEPFSLRKRIIQEQCAHFVLRYLTLNNRQLNNELRKIRVIGLAGPQPVLAVLSYMRRGLATWAKLYEKDFEIYRDITLTKTLPGLSDLEEENENIKTVFWDTKESKKRIKIKYGDYLNNHADTQSNFQGFLLDHCGVMPSPKKLRRYINARTNNGVFYVEATMIDGRGSCPRTWSYEFENELYNKDIFVLAKDSYEYKGGTQGSQCGSSMKTFIWVFEKKPDEIIVN